MDETGPISIRRLVADDSLDELTELLHRAYKSLADLGLEYVATHQSVAVTLERIASGTCLVAIRSGEIVGTVLYRNSDQTKGCAWYARPEVAHVSQLAVEPQLQGRGIATKLMHAVEDLARNDGSTELALDTAEPATRLIAWYERLGYRLVDHADWEVTNYRSVVLSKRL